MDKRLKVLLLSTMMIVGNVGLVGCSKKSNVSEDTNIKVHLILDQGGPNDQSFNQSAWEGALKSKEEYENLEVSYIEAKSEADFTGNIETAIEQGSDLIIGVGFKLGSAIEEAAKMYPDQKFAAIDCNYADIPSNLAPLLFNEHQSGYAAGLIAAETTETNQVSFLAGMDIPSVTGFYDGFKMAIKETNPDVNVSIQFANSFTDAAKGRAMAEQMILNKSDIIFTAAGGCNQGVFEAARENNIKAIGVDMPSSHIAPDVILTSALKDVGVSVQLIISDVINEQFKGGEVKMFDLTNGGVGYEKTKLLSEDLMKSVDAKLDEMKNNPN